MANIPFYSFSHRFGGFEDFAIPSIFFDISFTSWSSWAGHCHLPLVPNLHHQQRHRESQRVLEVRPIGRGWIRTLRSIWDATLGQFEWAGQLQISTDIIDFLLGGWKDFSRKLKDSKKVKNCFRSLFLLVLKHFSLCFSLFFHDLFDDPWIFHELSEGLRCSTPKDQQPRKIRLSQVAPRTSKGGRDCAPQQHAGFLLTWHCFSVYNAWCGYLDLDPPSTH